MKRKISSCAFGCAAMLSILLVSCASKPDFGRVGRIFSGEPQESETDPVVADTVASTTVTTPVHTPSPATTSSPFTMQLISSGTVAKRVSAPVAQVVEAEKALPAAVVAPVPKPVVASKLEEPKPVVVAPPTASKPEIQKPVVNQVKKPRIVAFRAPEKPRRYASASPPPAPEPENNLIVRNWNSGVLKMSKMVPAIIAVGEVFTNVISIEAAATTTEVEITEEIPASVVFLESIPKAEVKDGKLVWKFPSMHPGDRRTLEARFMARAPGELSMEATARGTTSLRTVSDVRQPVLVLTNVLPTKPILNKPTSSIVRISNVGNMTAKDIAVTNMLPQQFRNATGDTLHTWSLPELRPGQTKEFKVEWTGSEWGDFRIDSYARAANAAHVSAEQVVHILQIGLKATMKGPAFQYLGKTARYDIDIHDTGETDDENVVVVFTAPPGSVISNAPNATVDGQTATWKIDVIKTDEHAKMYVDIGATNRGEFTASLNVRADGGLNAKASAKTKWEGISALLITVSDDKDPIQVGQFSKYTILLRNQGTGDDTNIRVLVEFGDEMRPVAANERGEISGKRVVFPPIERLGPGQERSYTVAGQAEQTGAHRIRVTKISADSPQPTVVEESTSVF